MTAARPRRALAVRRLLVDREGGVEAPEDEDRQQRGLHERTEVVDLERIEPGQREGIGVGVLRPLRHVPERRDDDGRQRQELHRDHEVLHPGAALDAPVVDGAHDHDEQHPDRGHDDLVLGQFGRVRVAGDRPVQLDRIDAHDVGRVGHEDHTGDRDPPAPHPADSGIEGLRAPGEGCPAVGDHPVQFAVGDGDEDDRDEGDHDGRGGVVADLKGQVAHGGGQGEGGGSRRETDGDATEQSDGVVLQALVLDVVNLWFQYFVHHATS